MEAKLRSRKRKQIPPSSSNPFKGIFTRSKSQIYLHHSRSGRARSDVIRRCNHTQLVDVPPPVRSRRSNEQEALHTDNLSHISIKDLRARRVFSPTSSVIEDDDVYSKGGISKFDYDCQILNDESPNLCSKSEDDKDDGLERSDLENVTNPSMELIVDLNKEISFVEGSCDGNLNESVGAVNLSEECVQMTPPESDEIGENGGRNGGAISNAIVCKNIIDGSNVSISRSKRVKVFKTPSSFSYRRLLPYLMDISKDDSCNCVQKIEIVDVEFPCKVQKLNHMSPNLSSVTVDNRCVSKQDDYGAHSSDRKLSENGGIEANNMELHNKEQRRNDVGENTVDMNDESYQMTPPDPDIFSKPDEGDGTKNKEDDILLNEDAVLDKPLNGSLSGNGGGDIGKYPDCDQRKGFVSKSKLVLNPCSRVKVFKAPSSVSYRRLLPFLIDVAKDNPCYSTISQGPKHVKDTDQKLHPVISPSLPLDVQRGKSEADSISEDQSLPISMDDSTDEPKQSLPISTVTFNNGPSNNKESNSVSCENGTQLQEPLDLEQQTNNDIVSYAANCTEVSSSSIVNLENIPRGCELDVSKGALVESKGDPVQQMDNENEELIKENPLGINVGSIRKGILRRNPRGCRGLCNCLNCASFHLHAEKAFEFSRNQIHDAEEVASELIKELAYLRKILNETAANPRAVKVNQVKEACSKALKTEQLVKKRLDEMNEDLKFHCRNDCLPRPRVTFSDNVEKKFIPKAGLTWK